VSTMRPAAVAPSCKDWSRSALGTAPPRASGCNSATSHGPPLAGGLIRTQTVRYTLQHKT